MYISAISINGEVGSLVWPLDAYRPLNKFLCGGVSSFIFSRIRIRVRWWSCWRWHLILNVLATRADFITLLDISFFMKSETDGQWFWAS